MLAVPPLELRPGFWERAGRLRPSVLAEGRRAGLAGTLIAQCCLDHGVPLISRDADFGAFQAAGLALLP